MFLSLFFILMTSFEFLFSFFPSFTLLSTFLFPLLTLHSLSRSKDDEENFCLDDIEYLQLNDEEIPFFDPPSPLPPSSSSVVDSSTSPSDPPPFVPSSSSSQVDQKPENWEWFVRKKKYISKEKTTNHQPPRPTSNPFSPPSSLHPPQVMGLGFFARDEKTKQRGSGRKMCPSSSSCGLLLLVLGNLFIFCYQ